MNDTYGLPICFTCCRPESQFDRRVSASVLEVCIVSASLGVGLKNWTIHIPSPTTAHNQWQTQASQQC